MVLGAKHPFPCSMFFYRNIVQWKVSSLCTHIMCLMIGMIGMYIFIYIYILKSFNDSSTLVYSWFQLQSWTIMKFRKIIPYVFIFYSCKNKLFDKLILAKTVFVSVTEWNLVQEMKQRLSQYDTLTNGET